MHSRTYLSNACALSLIGMSCVNSTPLPRSNQSAPAIRWVDCASNVPVTLLDPSLNFTLPSQLPSSLQCGELDVPMNYSEPFSDDNKITVGFAMNRPANSQGLINFNPGGPGQEARSFAWAFALNLTAYANFTGFEEYDFLAMDVRGTFSSTPLNCTANFTLSSKIPTTEEEFQVMQSNGGLYLESCSQLTSPPEYVRLTGTEQVVQDWSSLRAALGYKKMHLLGWSYGTSGGALFASKFPEQVGRFVLDGVAPPGMSNFQFVDFQLKDANRLVERADAFCIADPICPFNAQGKGAVTAAFTLVLQMAEAGQFENVTVDDIRAMTALTYFRGQPNFVAFNEALAGAVNGSAVGFDYASFEPIYTPGLATVLPIICEDQHVDATDFASFQNLTNALKADDTYNITYSQILTIVVMCNSWPEHGIFNEPLPLESAMLLVSADFDLNTPLETVNFQAAQAPNSTVMIRHGDTHVSFTIPSDAREAEIKFLTTGQFPEATNTTLLTVYPPSNGTVDVTVEDPYLVPVGALAGDIPEE